MAAGPHAPDPVAAVRFAAATPGDIDTIMELEQAAYPIAWTRGNFHDVLAHPESYAMQLLWGEPSPGVPRLLGYFVAMPGVDEAHLLNVAVHPDFQGQGWGVLLLQRLRHWAELRGAGRIWLEVRHSNPQARAMYERFGYRAVGLRKRYYPAVGGGREDATVMCLLLG